MRLPVGVSIQTVARDLYVFIVFAIGFALGAGWQYIDKQSTKISSLQGAVTAAAKAEKVSSQVSEKSQEYANKSIEGGRSYVEAVSSCSGYSDDEYRLLNNLIKESNAFIGTGEVPGNKRAKK